MKIAIPHQLQPDNYTCGPTCLAMALDFFGRSYTRDEVVELCKTKPGRGTENHALVFAIVSHGLCAHTKQRATIHDIQNAFNESAVIIVNYFNPVSNVGHFAVVQGFDDTHIYLADPKNGENYTLTHSIFSTHWHNHTKTLEAWMVTIAEPHQCQHDHCKKGR
jgi:ABC-type bacteriocin/lantibiotic exporter with double-glycine peptidase domain